MSIHDDLTFLVNASRTSAHLRAVVGRIEAEVALLQKQRDNYSGRVTEMEYAGGHFLRAYLDASVSDEEGLLAALDAREWTAMWVTVDEKAQEFGRVLGTSLTPSQETFKYPDHLTADAHDWEPPEPMVRGTVDGVEYSSVPCVRCHVEMVIATDALLVADRKNWPICTKCWDEIP